jgi:hypothetical protein
VTNYRWDAESQLKSAAGMSYTYDGDGRRRVPVAVPYANLGNPQTLTPQFSPCDPAKRPLHILAGHVHSCKPVLINSFRTLSHSMAGGA